MTYPISTDRPRTVLRSLLLKAAVVVPDVLISSLLWLLIIAALPPVVGFVLAVGGLVIGAVLAAGLGEDTAVRFLYRARRATPAEAPRLAVAWRIATHQADADGVRLRIVPHGPPVGTAGRHHVLLRRDVVDAFCANQVTARQVARLIADGLGRLRHGHVRFDLLWTVWTIPWDLIRGAAYAIGRRLACIPLVQFAWRTRLVVGTIAVVIEAQEGRVMSSIIIATFISLTYVMPLAQRAWERQLVAHAGRIGGTSAAGSDTDDGLFTSLRACAGSDLRSATRVASSWCRPSKRPGGSPSRLPNSSRSPHSGWRLSAG